MAMTSTGLVRSNGCQTNGVDNAVSLFVQQLSTLRADIISGTHSRIAVPETVLRAQTQQNGNAPDNSVVKPLANGHYPNVSHEQNRDGPLPGISGILKPVPVAVQSAPKGQKTLPSRPDAPESVQEKRRRIERVLEEQIQARRLAAKQKPCDQEMIADFDVDAVLRRAHELITPFKPRDARAANRAASSSDSFDQNTFYSSQMNDSTTTDEAEGVRNPRRPLRACRFFRDGKPCPYGDKCTFSHDPSMFKQVDPAETTKMTVASAARIVEDSVAPVPSFADPPSSSRPDMPVANAVRAIDPQAARIAELEEQLRLLKEAQNEPKIIPRALNRDERVKSDAIGQVGPVEDEFGRDIAMRKENVSHPPPPTMRVPAQSVQAIAVHPFREPSPPRPVEIQVVRNQIASPHAPQPARVSPLAIARLPLLVQNSPKNGPDTATPHNVIADNSSSGESPNAVGLVATSRKRRRGPEGEESARKVAPRREIGASPLVRIKQEPISPPPYSNVPIVREARPVPERAQPSPYRMPVPRAQERAMNRPQVANDVYEVSNDEVPPRLSESTILRNSQAYLAQPETGLRRVVSTRSLRAPPSPVQQDVYDPYRRSTNMFPEDHYFDHMPPPQYRASVHPQMHEPAEPHRVRSVAQSPMRRTSIPMPPPATRRVVVDQYGNRFLEAPPLPERAASNFPVDGDFESSLTYEPYEPRKIFFRRPQPVIIDDDLQYSRSREPIASSPQYIEYPTVARKRRIVQLDDDEFDDQTPILYEPTTAIQYRNVDSRESHPTRIQSARPMSRRYDIIDADGPSRPAEAPRPRQSRLISAGEHRESPLPPPPSARILRHASAQPNTSTNRPLQRVQRMVETTSQSYQPQQPGTDYDEAPHFINGALYDPPAGNARLLVHRA